MFLNKTISTNITVLDVIIGKAKRDKTDHQHQHQHDTEDPSKKDNIYEYGFLPPNYDTSHQFVRSAYVHVLGLIGVGVKAVMKVKQNHKWSRQLLKALMKRPYAAFTGTGGQPELTTEESWAVEPDDMVSVYQKWKQGNDNSITESPGSLLLNTKSKGTETVVGETSGTGTPTLTPQAEKDPTAFLVAAGNAIVEKVNEILSKEDPKDTEPDEKETAFLVAARNGIVEMVDEILSKIPSAIHNINSQKENVLLVAVRNRQPLVVKALKMRLKTEFWNNLFLGVDKSENTVLHLAAPALREGVPMQVPGSALQMMWDIKWFEYIKSLVPQHFYFRSNNKNETAGVIFKETHKELVKESSEWLKDTSESCSVVAALIAAVSFATTGTVPGGTDDSSGKPILERQPVFETFAIASLIGLCFSITSLIMFLSILTSRKLTYNFRQDLPLKILLGLSSLFVSIAALFVSFCTGHFFLLNHKYQQFLFPIYAATCLPVSFFAIAQFPLYVDLLLAILTKVPGPSDKDDYL